MIVNITQLDSVARMKRYPCVVVRQAYIEMKDQHPNKTFMNLLRKGISSSFSWRISALGPMYWSDMKD